MNEDDKELYAGCGLSKNNQERISDDGRHGCYYCVSVFKGDKITQWTDNGETALCPNCGIDAVIPNETNIDFLWKAHTYWFDEPKKDEA